MSQGDEVNPSPATKVSKLAHRGKFLFILQYLQKVRKLNLKNRKIFATFELFMI